jgi:hypothetical protein
MKAYVAPKIRDLSEPHYVTAQKIVFFSVTVVRSSNQTTIVKDDNIR